MIFTEKIGVAFLQRKNGLDMGNLESNFFNGTLPSKTRMPNLLSMANLIFILMIFFILSSRNEPQPQYSVSTPEARAGDKVSNFSLSNVIELDPAGNIKVENISISISELSTPSGLGKLSNLLAPSADGTKQKSITIAADRNANAIALVKLLAALKAVGIKELSVLTRTPSATPAQSTGKGTPNPP